MAQTLEQVTLDNKAKRLLKASNLAVTVAQAGTTALLEFSTRELERIFVSFDVTGQDLDAFSIQAAAHPSAAYQTLYSAAGSFTSPAGLIVGASGDLTIVAAGATGWFIMDVRGLDRVKILASSGNVAGSTVSAYAGGR